MKVGCPIVEVITPLSYPKRNPAKWIKIREISSQKLRQLTSDGQKYARADCDESAHVGTEWVLITVSKASLILSRSSVQIQWRQ